ncbi:hypothetical protein ACHAXT_005068 [Thalassiosira profunda]
MTLPPRRCHAVVPRHNTSLAAGARWWAYLLREACRAATDEDEDGAAMHEHKTCDVLALQCHSEGGVWRGLAPPLLMPEGRDSAGDYSCEGDCKRRRRRRIIKSPSCALIEVLTTRFCNHICRIDAELALENCGEADDGDREAAQNNTTASFVDDWFTQQHTCHSHKARVPLILLLLPPNPQLPSHQSYSRTPSTSPTNPFALRLILLENTMIRLSSLSAYVSTLGGGFFLCRFLSTAVALARHQQRLALLRHDAEMALKCRINEGYCHIHAGNLQRGRRIIRRAWRDAEILRRQRGVADEDGWHHTPERELHELTVIGNMCRSALRFARLVGEAREDGEGGGVEEKNRAASSTHDDFQRIRIVRDRSWRR